MNRLTDKVTQKPEKAALDKHQLSRRVSCIWGYPTQHICSLTMSNIPILMIGLTSSILGLSIMCLIFKLQSSRLSTALNSWTDYDSIDEHILSDLVTRGPATATKIFLFASDDFIFLVLNCPQSLNRTTTLKQYRMEPIINPKQHVRQI